LYFQLAELGRQLRLSRCDALFSPGGMVLRRHGDRPTFTMCRTMLPFEEREVRRYAAASADRIRLRALGILQRRSMERADGVIFLTEYARVTLAPQLRRTPASTVIAHGVDQTFFRRRPDDERDAVFSTERPFRLLYVSTIDLYKHQWHVADAVARLRAAGLPLTLTMIGPVAAAAADRFASALAQFDPDGSFLRHMGRLPHADLPAHYHDADAFVFASSCENMPNVLLEAMAAGLPIASSRIGPMPEILGDAGLYFDPEQPEEIAACIERLVNDSALRGSLARRAFDVAQRYSWRACAGQTMDFIRRLTVESRIQPR
jgi:glycosyltransferase involved in cell wall biosynthesis